MVPGMSNMTYEEKLVKLGISKLVERRFRGDMIETHKIITNKGGLNSDSLFDRRVERGDPELHRGHKIFKKRCEKGVRSNFFSQRVVNPWNNLRKEEVQANKTSGFKGKFDKNEKERKRARAGSERHDLTLYKKLYSDIIWY